MTTTYTPERLSTSTIRAIWIAALVVVTICASLVIAAASSQGHQGASPAPRISVAPNIPSSSQGLPLVPASNTQATWQSANWSGYAETNLGPYTGVTSQWRVPTVAATTSPTYSAAWIGIDGFNNQFLIQTGTEQDFYNGAPHYVAWWTTSSYGFYEQPIPRAVNPNDVITAKIARVGMSSEWEIYLTDVTSNWSFSEMTFYRGPAASAEWIMEAPGVNGQIANISHFSTVSFDPGTIDNNISPRLVASEAGVLVQRVGGVNEAVSTPSVPNPEANGFSIAYGSTAPPPPS